WLQRLIQPPPTRATAYRVALAIGGSRVIRQRVNSLRYRILNPLIDRARAVAVDQVDAVVEPLSQFGFGDLARDVLKDCGRVSAGLPHHPARPRTDVAGTVHQASPEPKRHAGSKTSHGVG